MSNPFLFDDDDNGGDVASEAVSNPFLQDAPAESTEFENADNPFFAASTQASNPFADYDNDVGQIQQFDNTQSTAEVLAISEPTVTATSTKTANVPSVDSAMSFFGTTIKDEEEQESNAFGTTENLYDDSQDDTKSGPPPRPNPPNQATQDLISSLADQLDQTSSHLLGRIPVTRTPSPVSMRDLHSPSPTPDCADLLDVTDNLDDLDTHEIAENSNLRNDNPFADVGDDLTSVDDQLAFDPAPQSQFIEQKPAVLPPSRPPRPTPPTPPQRPSPPSQVIQPHRIEQPPIAAQEIKPSQDNEADLFDMFGIESIPKQQANVPKSNQDIMNLFAAPKNPVVEPQPKDLLTDIFSMSNEEQISSNLPSVVSSVKPPVPPPPRTAKIVHTQNEFPVATINGDVHEQSQIPTPTPNTFIEQNAPIELETAAIQINDEPLSSFVDNVASIDIEKSDTLSDNSSAIESGIRTPEISTPYYTGAPGGEFLDRGQTPVSRDEIVNSYNNDTSYVSPTVTHNPFGSPEGITQPLKSIARQNNDEFDAFAAKFDSVKKDDVSLLDGFGSVIASGYKSPAPAADAWGANDFAAPSGDVGGFEAEEGFDSFYAMKAPSEENDDDSPKELNVFIRPKDSENSTFGTATAILAPPPSRGSQNSSIYCEDSSPRFGPSDRSDEALSGRSLPISDDHKVQRTDSLESPSTPLFDDDVSQPLEDFPRTTYVGTGWEMQLRQPNKKKITGQRFWKKIFLRFVTQGDTPVVQLLNSAKDKDPFQELPLQGCYSVSEISAQPFDQFGKIFTIKLQYIFYKERPGVRPGQVTKAERLTTKLSQFAAFAIQGDYQGVKEFGSDLKKLGLPVEHAPQVSQLFKIGSHNFEDLKQFSVCIEEQLFKFNVHRDRALTYKSEEVQVTAVDELYVEQSAEGHIIKQIARVRLFFLAFLSGMPTIELGVNDLWRQGKEVVGRHDIIPVVTEEWIRLEGVEFHTCVQQNEYERSRLIRFQPPDACYIELMRFRIRPPKNRELPLQLKATWIVTGNKVELRADVLVPGFASRKLGQIPCEDVSIRFPIPECWIYLFRVEKHFRYGSVKSAHRRTGKIKGIERILGTVDQVQESLIEVTSGQAKYEHHHRAIVWRCPRLPKEGQGAYTTHQMVVRMALTSYDQIPEQLAEYCYVEFTMPATQASHTTVRSVSVQDSDSDDPPEKYVRYLARHEYKVGIEHTQGESQNAYLAATCVKKAPAPAPAPIKEEPPATVPEVSDSDSDSN